MTSGQSNPRKGRTRSRETRSPACPLALLTKGHFAGHPAAPFPRPPVILPVNRCGFVPLRVSWAGVLRVSCVDIYIREPKVIHPNLKSPPPLIVNSWERQPVGELEIATSFSY